MSSLRFQCIPVLCLGAIEYRRLGTLHITKNL